MEEISYSFPFGLMELDGTGRVIRYSPASEKQSDTPAYEIIGQDFFKDIAPVGEVAEFKGRFLAFMAFGDSVQRLTIRFSYEHLVIKAQIVLARITDHIETEDERLALVRLMPDV
jgi:photoactive yellow protein